MYFSADTILEAESEPKRYANVRQRSDFAAVDRVQVKLVVVLPVERFNEWTEVVLRYREVRRSDGNRSFQARNRSVSH